jgi:DNA-directed RNA polymerase subunit RPC12/RpoP
LAESVIFAAPPQAAARHIKEARPLKISKQAFSERPHYMTRVYQSATVEAEGFEIETDQSEIMCPKCSSRNSSLHQSERVESGSLNIYRTLQCDDCGHHRAD